MSIIGLQKWGKRNKVIPKLFWFGMAGILAIGTFLGFGSNKYGGGGAVRGGSSAPDPIAAVDGIGISREAFNRQLAMQAQMMGRNADPSMLSFLKQSAFNMGERSVVVAALLAKEAQRRRISVSNSEVYKRIDESVEMSVMQMRFGYRNPKRFERDIETRYGSFDKLKDELKKGSSSPAAIEEIRRGIALEALQKKIRDEVKVKASDYLESLRKVKVRQILIKPKAAATPPQAPDAKGKTEAKVDGKDNPESVARQEATELLKVIRKEPERFEFFARQRSEETTYDPKKNKPIAAAVNGGLIGWIGAGEKKWQYGDDYESAVFKAKAGTIIDHVIKCSDGYRIVKIEDIKTEYPKDYDKVTYKCEGKVDARADKKTEPNDKNSEAKPEEKGKTEGKATAKAGAKSKSSDTKECGHTWDSTEVEKKCPRCGSDKVKATVKQKDQLFDQWKEQKQQQHWSEFVQKLSKDGEARTVVYDPELKAMKLENEGDPKKLNEAVGLYKEALKYANGDPFIKAAGIHMHLSTLYGRLADKDNQIAELRLALKEHTDANLNMQAANLLIEKWEGGHGDDKKKADAEKARKEAVTFLARALEEAGENDTHIVTQVGEAFKRLGDKDKQLATLKAALAKKYDPALATNLANVHIERWEKDKADAADDKRKAADEAKAEAIKILGKATREIKEQQQYVHNTIAESYKRLGMTEEEKAEREAAKPKPITRKEDEKKKDAKKAAE